MRIFSWNVNGLRAVVKKGFFDWLNDEAPDVATEDLEYLLNCGTTGVCAAQLAPQAAQIVHIAKKLKSRLEHVKDFNNMHAHTHTHIF